MKENKKDQLKLYDELYSSEDVSALYDRYLEETFFKISNTHYFFPKLFNVFLKDRVVLDIGCGGGNIGTKIIDKVTHLVNLDISFNALLHARERIGSNKSDYIQGDLASLPFELASFDVIVCYAALHHIDNIDIVAEEINRILKRGGVFLCFEPAERYAWVEFWCDFLRIPKPVSSFLKRGYIKLRNRFANQDNSMKIFKDLNHKKIKRHFFKNPAQYREAFIKNGFTDVKVETILIELLPPRFLTLRTKSVVRLFFRLSDLFHRLGIAKDKGKFIIIEAHK
jgi:ubiquinone/menaquinone biosynthesis C-methylase UbiE